MKKVTWFFVTLIIIVLGIELKAYSQANEPCQNPPRLYQDKDNDGFGNNQNFIDSCEVIKGYVPQSGDCNDDAPDINPTAPEGCDGLDNNCDNQIDEGCDNQTELTCANGNAPEGLGCISNLDTNNVVCLDSSLNKKIEIKSVANSYFIKASENQGHLFIPHNQHIHFLEGSSLSLYTFEIDGATGLIGGTDSVKQDGSILLLDNSGKIFFANSTDEGKTVVSSVFVDADKGIKNPKWILTYAEGSYYIVADDEGIKKIDEVGTVTSLTKETAALKVGYGAIFGDPGQIIMSSYDQAKKVSTFYIYNLATNQLITVVTNVPTEARQFVMDKSTNALLFTGSDAVYSITGLADLKTFPIKWDDLTTEIKTSEYFANPMGFTAGQFCVPAELDTGECIPSPDGETCNGTDDDCDFEVDEDIAQSATSCGVGECAATGELSCVGGTMVDSCTTGSGTTEICDGIDNDCDGYTDSNDPDDNVNGTCQNGNACDGKEECVNGSCVAGSDAVIVPASNTCTTYSCDTATGEVIATDIDNDGDKTPDCQDKCPDDSLKADPGTCGCGSADSSNDGDKVFDCVDNCPNATNNDQKDSDGDGIGDVCDAATDNCPDDPNKLEPGTCGCGLPDTDTDGDGSLDCKDSCIDDANKTAPGVCGCGSSDVSSDGDNVADCVDNCPTAANNNQQDSDKDGMGDACDAPSCGNNVKESGEVCDDGNNSANDGCGPTCVVEVCGDGLIQTSPARYEECDGGDDCAADCTLKSFCGDGTQDSGEACDDGNKNNGDGCDQECSIEEVAVCGDGTRQDPEVCDDGNTVGDDSCAADCSSALVTNCAAGEQRQCTPANPGVGRCATGWQGCNDTGIWGTCVAQAPDTEVCDEQDNDCDGQTDEDGVCDAQLVCEDGSEPFEVGCVVNTLPGKEDVSVGCYTIDGTQVVGFYGYQNPTSVASSINKTHLLFSHKNHIHYIPNLTSEAIEKGSTYSFPSTVGILELSEEKEIIDLSFSDEYLLVLAKDTNTGLGEVIGINSELSQTTLLTNIENPVWIATWWGKDEKTQGGVLLANNTLQVIQEGVVTATLDIGAINSKDGVIHKNTLMVTDIDNNKVYAYNLPDLSDAGSVVLPFVPGSVNQTDSDDQSVVTGYDTEKIYLLDTTGLTIESGTEVTIEESRLNAIVEGLMGPKEIVPFKACPMTFKSDELWIEDQEVCDGVDNNNNGQVDEDFLVGESCSPVGVSNPCQAGTYVCDANGGVICEVTNLVDGTSCNDGLFCNGQETCQAGSCVAGTAPTIPASEDCSDYTCSEETDKIVTVNKANGTSCDDGDLCNGTSTCQNGACIDGTPVVVSTCEHPCKYHECNPQTGDIVTLNKTDDTSCGDTNACNGEETCQSGECSAGTVVSVPDDTPCITYSCNNNTGEIVATNVTNGTSCDDGNSCTTDQCVDGACVGNAVDSEACDTGLSGICAEGKTLCAVAGTTCEQTNQAENEICDDNLDNDCDGKTDLEDSDCDDLCPDGSKPKPAICMCNKPDLNKPDLNSGECMGHDKDVLATFEKFDEMKGATIGRNPTELMYHDQSTMYVTDSLTGHTEILAHPMKNIKTWVVANQKDIFVVANEQLHHIDENNKVKVVLEKLDAIRVFAELETGDLIAISAAGILTRLPNKGTVENLKYDGVTTTDLKTHIANLEIKDAALYKNVLLLANKDGRVYLYDINKDEIGVVAQLASAEKLALSSKEGALYIHSKKDAQVYKHSLDKIEEYLSGNRALDKVLGTPKPYHSIDKELSSLTYKEFCKIPTVITPPCDEDEICDGVDNDCDNEIDEGFEVDQACSTTVNDCTVEGVNICNSNGSDVECDISGVDTSNLDCSGTGTTSGGTDGSVPPPSAVDEEDSDPDLDNDGDTGDVGNVNQGETDDEGKDVDLDGVTDPEHGLRAVGGCASLQHSSIPPNYFELLALLAFIGSILVFRKKFI